MIGGFCGIDETILREYEMEMYLFKWRVYIIEPYAWAGKLFDIFQLKRHRLYFIHKAASLKQRRDIAAAVGYRRDHDAQLIYKILSS